MANPRKTDAPPSGGTAQRKAQERDITILTQSQLRMSGRARVLERLLHLFSDVERLAGNLDDVLDAALEAIPAEAGSILLVDAEGADFRFVAARGPVGARLLGIRLPLHEGLAGDCARQRKPLSVSDVKQDPRFSREISERLGFETKSLLAAPMMHKGDVLGVIEIVNRKWGDVFPRHEVELLDRIARAAGSLVRLGGALGARLPEPPSPPVANREG